MATHDPEPSATPPPRGSAHSGGETPRNVLPDLVIPIVALIFTAYYLTTITEVPWISQASAVTVSCLLLACIAAYVVRTVARIRSGRETIAWPAPAANRVVTIQRVMLLGLTIGYVVLLDALGFTLATMLFVFCGIVTLATPARWRSAAIVAVTCSATGYVVFIRVFQTRFPKGIIENLLAGLF